MDRNIKNNSLPGLKAVVALRKESVDRNVGGLLLAHFFLASLSARRAWIEIISVTEYIPEGSASLSARRAWIEIPTRAPKASSVVSLSARRAWIEILYSFAMRRSSCVALRKESVDRNIHTAPPFCVSVRRSPQGERG